MATHDYVIANGTGASVRSDLNDALAAIVSQNSSATAPATTYAYMTWADTTTGLFKIRNAANNAWITLYKLDGNFTDITLSAQGDLRFADSDSSNWVAFQAPATVASNVTWTLPSTDGTSGQLLSTDGSGTLSWAAAGTSQWTTSGSNIYYTTGKVLVGTSSATTNGGKLEVSDGITFPATQVACSNVNTLDDYEEGTFTPTVAGTTTAGTATYSAQNGRYTKIGRLVHFEVYVFWSGGTGAGNLKIAGLPFTCNNGATFPAVAVAGQNNVASSANTYLNAYVNQNTTDILILENPTGGGARASVAYDAAGELVLAGSYSV